MAHHSSVMRPVPSDALRIGMWLVVTAWEVEEFVPTPFGDERRRVMRPIPTRWVEGREPMQVHAVSLPFIAVRGVLGDGRLEIWDVRQMRLAEANRSLVRVCKDEARRLAAKVVAEKRSMGNGDQSSPLI